MHHCRRYLDAPLSRREMLARTANGFGALALAALLADESCADTTSTVQPVAPLHGSHANAKGPFAARPPHFRAKAKSVIFLYMDGGVSQVDSFDPKPRLSRDSGQPFRMKIEPTQFNDNGNALGSPWKFRQYGESGIPVSDLFPHVATCVDDLAVVRSMTSNFAEHTSANYFLHTGSGLQGRPSMGAWAAYGLGSECQNLPGFVVVNSGLVPPGGLDNFNSGFLPATYQGSTFRPANPPVANINRGERTPQLQANKLALMKRLDEAALERLGAPGEPAHVDKLESAVANYELAFRMQAAVPDLVDLGAETAATKRDYGLESTFKPTQVFGTSCLIARRLVERGVRFIELTCPPTLANDDRWDQHSNLKDGHERNSRAVDQPIAALLKDLKARGLLGSTLVVWSGEFGRTPFAQGSNGRDHDPFAFSIWLAGGGVKGGVIYGQTDEYGYKAVENRVEMHDLHATILHLLGLDHKRVTFRYGGRDMRLTDVHGNVVREIVA